MVEYVHSSKVRPPLPPGPYLVVGLARSGVAAARALAARGQSVFGVDSGSPPDLEVLGREGVGFETGTEGTAHLEVASTVVKSPGVPSGAEVILEAHRRRIPVVSELEMGWRLVEAPMIAITGTNGKTTTTELAAHLYRSAGRPVAAAGNVGSPLSDLAVGEIEGDLTVVCECSSFQLEDTESFSPECAVILNLSPDHLDRHGDLESYKAAKLKIFRRQGVGDVAVLNAGDPGLQEIEPPGEAQVVRFVAAGDGGPADECELTYDGELILLDGEPLVAAGELQIIGRHNIANAMAAAAAAISMGLPRRAVADGLKSFTGLAHRLEPVAEIGGTTFINDSKATNVEAAVTGLRSFEGGVHLILGGSGKGEPFDDLLPVIAERCAAVYLIGETMDELAGALAALSGLDLQRSGDLETAVSEAAESAGAGETVLLSPACASFDQFSDYEARGERFSDLVEALRGE
jgi:UDP-N-acetylmuramoylalanine--D-glutamate ligase